MLKQSPSMRRGDIDGPNLNDGTQVKLPPHLTFSWSSRATVQSSRSCSQRTRSLSASSCCQLARTLLSFLRCVLRVDETMYLTELHMDLSSESDSILMAIVSGPCQTPRKHANAGKE